MSTGARQRYQGLAAAALLLTLLSPPVQAEQRSIPVSRHHPLSLLSCSMPHAWYCNVLLRKQALRPSPPVPIN